MFEALLLALAGGLAIAVQNLIIKAGQRAGVRDLQLMTVISVVAALVLLGVTLGRGLAGGENGLGLLPLRAIGLAVGMGVCFALTMVCALRAMAHGSLALTFVMLNLGSAVPILLVWQFIAKDRPSVMQMPGLLAFIGSIILIAWPRKKEASSAKPLGWWLFAVGCLLANGMFLFGYRLMEHVGYNHLNDTIQVVVFGLAGGGFALLSRFLVPSGGWGKALRYGLPGGALFAGGIGLFAYADAAHTGIRYSLFGAAIIVGTTLGAMLFFSERIGHLTKIGIGLAILAVALMSG